MLDTAERRRNYCSGRDSFGAKKRSNFHNLRVHYVATKLLFDERHRRRHHHLNATYLPRLVQFREKTIPGAPDKSHLKKKLLENSVKREIRNPETIKRTFTGCLPVCPCGFCDTGLIVIAPYICRLPRFSALNVRCGRHPRAA